jgi:hypothetical protein
LTLEPANEVQKGQQAAQHEERETQDQPGRGHHHRQSQNLAVQQPGVGAIITFFSLVTDAISTACPWQTFSATLRQQYL